MIIGRALISPDRKLNEKRDDVIKAQSFIGIASAGTRQHFYQSLECPTSKWSVCEQQFQNNAWTYRFNQLITYYNAKYGSVGRTSASNLISSDLTPKLRRAY